MKSKKDFTSISSNGSFVLALCKGQSTKVKMTIEIDLKDFDAKEIKTREDLDAYIKEYYEDEFLGDPSWRDLAENYLDKGYTLIEGEVFEDPYDIVSSILWNKGLAVLGPQIIILQNIIR